MHQVPVAMSSTCPKMKVFFSLKMVEPLPQKYDTELSYFTLLNLLTYMQDF